MRAKALRGAGHGHTEGVGEAEMELREGGWGRPVYYFNSTNLSCDFRIHVQGSCFISFSFSDHLTPSRDRLV